MRKMVCLMAALGATVSVEATWARPDLVEKVARGELAEAEVSWWGYDGADATPYIQAALSSKARKVTLDRREGLWFARPLFGRSNLTLVVPEGVTLCAKRGEFRRQGDFLLRFNTATNVTLTGGGTIKMWFEDYTNKALYGWSEWRLFDPAGKCTWDVDDIVGSEMWCSPTQPAPGLWKLAALKATKGCMDDYSFGVFGIPCLMFLSPEKTWQEK